MCRVKPMTEGDLAVWLSSFLPGRVLLWEELLSAVQDHGWTLPEAEVRRQIKYLCHTGAVQLMPAVVPVKGEKEGLKDHFRCQRCGEERRVVVRVCATCGQRCATCEACLGMGRCRSCALLVIGEGRPERVADVAVPLDGGLEEELTRPLTPLQRQAAAAGVRIVRGEMPQRELLIHAVTGAGKTEITFPAILEALRRGMRIGVVTPRRDVVLELFPRLRRAFPQVAVAALYGGSQDRWAMTPLMIMTAHQALRFRRAFSLLIIDEVDAFPYHHEPLLPRAVAQALARQGRIIYLTATPPAGLEARVAIGEVAAVVIPRRHHGHPLPVPRWEPVGRLRWKLRHGEPIPAVERLLNIVRQTAGRLLVFVPRVADVPQVVRWWRRQFAEMADQVDGVHAGDPNRDEKVAAFRGGHLQVLVTTTILERGVTVPRCHVLVMEADAPVFDAAALVQIAGRAGRDAAFPSGEVWFCSEFRTEAMVQACRQIKEMNRQAEKCGVEEGESVPMLRGHRGMRMAREKSPRPFVQAAFRWLFGERESCAFCGRTIFQAVDWRKGRVSLWVPGKPGTGLCRRCLGAIQWLTGDVPLCRRCGRFLSEQRAQNFCYDCRRWEAAGTALFRNRSIADYGGLLREQWQAYKYGGRRSLETLWREMMVYGWLCHRDDLGFPDEIVYVPMHPTAMKERGFNQAQVLASGLARYLGIPVAERLQRVRGDVRQSRQGREERMQLLDGAFCLSPDANDGLSGKRILLVDDIYTTGSTLEACARLLRKGGAGQVVSLTLARA